MIAKEILIEIARKKGLTNKEHVEKDYFQDLFLFNLYKRTNLLVFKGGTCLYKIYNLPRFSEDLDFSILKNFDVEETIKQVVGGIEDAEVKEIKKIKNSLLIKIKFKGLLTRYNTIRIDINLKNPIIDKVDIKHYIPSYIDINPFSIKTLSLKEIVAEKIHSLLSREKARDLYDLFFLLRLVSLNKNFVNKKLENFGMKFEYLKLKNNINNLETLWEKELKFFVLSDLPKFNIVKNFVLKELNNIR